jgi:hypothetical protein
MIIKFNKETPVNNVFNEMVKLNNELSITEWDTFNVLYVPDTLSLNDVLSLITKYDNSLSEEDSFAMYAVTSFLYGYFRGMYNADII